MNDEQILVAMGLSEADATDLARKHQAFLASLNPAQFAAVSRSLPTPAAAAAAISPDCTVDDLNNFIAKRCHSGPAHGAAAFPAPVAAAFPVPVGAAFPAPVAAAFPAPVAGAFPAPVCAAFPVPVAPAEPAPSAAAFPAPVDKSNE
jgi:hypothetical protein